MMGKHLLNERLSTKLSSASESGVAPSGGVLQRKSACGGSTSPTLSCSRFEKKKLLGQPLQTKLRINEPGDACEREADRAMQLIMKRPKSTNRTVAPRIPEPPLVQQKADVNTVGPATVPPIVSEVLSMPGQPLDAATRLHFEHHFGHDFSNVRIHADSKAAASAQAVNALAYTVGHDVVFGAGQYGSGLMSQNRLLAHELAHTVQQQLGSVPQLQRTEIIIGDRSFAVNFDHLHEIDEKDMPEQIVSMANSWTEEVFLLEDIQSLDSDARRWLLFAIQFLMDNPWKDMSLPEKASHVFLLIGYAPKALHHPPDNENFARDVLRALKRLKNVVTSNVTAPDKRTKKKIKKMVASKVKKKLDAEELQRRLVPALTHLLRYKDPDNWARTGIRSFPVLQKLGDIILQEARIFFAPFADAADSNTNIFLQTPKWQGSSNIFKLGSRETSQEDILGLLWNRAEMVGRNTDPNAEGFSDANIFNDVSYNDNRHEDLEAMQEILEGMLDNNEIRETAGRINQITGMQMKTAIGPVIGLQEEFDVTRYPTACDAHWRGIDTLCHEIVHAMVHPDFEKVKERATFDQIIVEGFTEVLGAQLYNQHVLAKANNSPEYKSQLEAGVPGAPCFDVGIATVDYGDAGKRAEDILRLVGDDNFRAAYFLGKPELAGLPS
jgi:hypothetical protein